MKTTDLMIGDWVMLIDDKTGKPYKKAMITHIDSIHERIAAKTTTNTFVAWSTKYVEPIPLTSKILKKNRFEAIDDYDYYGVPNDPSLTIATVANTFIIGHLIDDNFEGFIALDYVHDLQHALKLCGIKDEIVL